jgi:hypothetical protein
MWSYLRQRLISPVAGQVENKPGDAERFTLDEIALLRVYFDRCRVSRVRRSLQKPSRHTGQPSVEALATVPGPGEASEGFLRTAAPIRFLSQ